MSMQAVERESETDDELNRVIPSGEMSSADNNRANRASSAPSRASVRSAVPAVPQKDSRKDSSVRVAVRIRPLLPKEIATNERVCVERKDNTIMVSSTEKRFTYVARLLVELLWGAYVTLLLRFSSQYSMISN